MENQKKEHIIDVIKKLFALSDNNPSKNEAIASALKAQQLMVKWNIQDYEILDEIKEESIDSAICNTGTGKKWKYQLGNIIAKNFRCKCYYKGSQNICFYGYSRDILIAQEVFLYLFHIGNRLANNCCYKYSLDAYSTKGVFNSFVYGFLNGISSSLEKQCTALMIVVPKKVSDSYVDFSSEFGKKDTNINLNYFENSAFANGVYKGKQAMDGRQLEKRK